MTQKEATRYFSLDPDNDNFTPVWNSLKSSWAYRTLAPTHKLVLLDMLRVFSREASIHTSTGSSTRFVFTFAHCNEDVGKGAFDGAIAGIVERGFFTQDYAPHSGKAKTFQAADTWKTWTPSQEVRTKLSMKVKAKAACLARPKLSSKVTVSKNDNTL